MSQEYPAGVSIYKDNLNQWGIQGKGFVSQKTCGFIPTVFVNANEQFSLFEVVLLMLR